MDEDPPSLDERYEWFGFVLAALVALALFIPIAALVIPIGPADTRVGRVGSVQFHGTDFGGVWYASVRLDHGQLVSVAIPPGIVCSVGDEVLILDRPTPLIRSYALRRWADGRVCPPHLTGASLPPRT